MPPSLKKLSSKEIIIIVVIVVVGVVFVSAAIALCWTRQRRRRQNKKEDDQCDQANLRGGGVDGGEVEREVVEFMKSGSLDLKRHASSELDSSGGSGSHQPSELGYTTRPWHEVPRTLQPGHENTACPEKSPPPPSGSAADTSHIELADTSSRSELPPDQAEQKLKPAPLNFSRPSREHVRLKCDTIPRRPMSPLPPPTGILKNADGRLQAPHRVSSPTIPTLLQQLKEDLDQEIGGEGHVSLGIAVERDKPKRVSFV